MGFTLRTPRLIGVETRRAKIFSVIRCYSLCWRRWISSVSLWCSLHFLFIFDVKFPVKLEIKWEATFIALIHCRFKILVSCLIAEQDKLGYLMWMISLIMILKWLVNFIAIGDVMWWRSPLLPRTGPSSILGSTAVDQAVERASVTHWARVPSQVDTSFLSEVFSGVSSPVRQMSGSFRPPTSPNIIWPSLSSIIIIHYGRQWSPTSQLILQPFFRFSCITGTSLNATSRAAHDQQRVHLCWCSLLTALYQG